jgi:flagellar motility protein MotE (MotC chaperone)
MIRFATLFAVPVVVFCGTLLGAAYVSGSLTEDDLAALFGRETPPPVEEATSADDQGAFARMLRDREMQLDNREEVVAEREARVLQQESELSAFRDQVTQMQADIAASLDSADAEQELKITDVAGSLDKMDAVKAAASLGNILQTDPDLAVRVMKQITPRKRGRILNEMTGNASAELFNEALKPSY